VVDLRLLRGSGDFALVMVCGGGHRQAEGELGA
jgi:hypothetical protein